jgi:hypothetical protein
MRSVGGFAMLTATSDRPAADGAFSKSLVNGIITGDADADRDGRIDPDELHRYVAANVPRQQPKLWQYNMGGTVVALTPRPKPKWPDGKRLALLIGSAEYEDNELRKLSAPSQDTKTLAELLSNPNIGPYETQVLVDKKNRKSKKL